MTGKRKRYSADFKAKVALEALKGELSAWVEARKAGTAQVVDARTAYRKVGGAD